jgi:hypothetical protein
MARKAPLPSSPCGFAVETGYLICTDRNRCVVFDLTTRAMGRGLGLWILPLP